jgi:hypothetical protein
MNEKVTIVAVTKKILTYMNFSQNSSHSRHIHKILPPPGHTLEDQSHIPTEKGAGSMEMLLKCMVEFR